MSDNLYQSTTTTSAISPASSNSGLDFISNIDLSSWLYWLNMFTFAWCIFYSLILLGNFYYYWVNFGDGEVENEKQGAKAISDAAWMWWSYLTAVLLYLAYKNTSGEFSVIIGWFAVVFYVCKIFVFDLPDIPFLSKIMGKPGDAITKSVEDTISGFGKAISEIGSNVFGLPPSTPPAPPAKK
jgi:hypothetical protein